MSTAAAEGRPGSGREAILAAAAELFARKGFRGTTVSDIAEAAKVNRALISYHFGSKAGLYGDLLDDAVSSAADMLERLSRELSPKPPEVQMVHVFARIYEAHPHLAPMLVREHLDPDYFLDAGHAEKLRGFIGLTRKVLGSIGLREEARCYDPQIVHLICVGAIIYFMITRSYRDRMQGKLVPPPTRPTIDQFADVLADFLSRALRD
jgi:AcrR family transcriptional regulator